MEDFKNLDFGELMGTIALTAGFIWTVIAYYRLRRRNDKKYGKGWRKRLNDY